MHNMAYPTVQELPKAEAAESFISKLHCSISNGLPHATPVSSCRIDEHELVKCVFQVLQGFNASLLHWNKNMQGYRVKEGIYASHLSQTSLRSILKPFVFAGTCLKRVEFFVQRVKPYNQRSPTLSAFANSVHSWLMKLREAALKEEAHSFCSDNRTITLLGLTDSMSSFFAGSEYLWQVVHGAVPEAFWNAGAYVSSSEVAVHILNHVFRKLNEVCLVEDGEGDSYHMLLVIFAESLLPYLQVVDSWLYDGILDDPYEEMFFYANSAVTIDQPSFWEMSYVLRVRESRNLVPRGHLSVSKDLESKKESSSHEPTIAASSLKAGNQVGLDILCPVFLKDIARAVVSAGKSLQLVKHVQDACSVLSQKGVNEFKISQYSNNQIQERLCLEISSFQFLDRGSGCADSPEESSGQFGNDARAMGFLTLSEVFLICLSGLLENGEHVYEHLRKVAAKTACMNKAFLGSQSTVQETTEGINTENSFKKTWWKLPTDVVSGRGHMGVAENLSLEAAVRDPTVVLTGTNNMSSNTEWHYNPSYPANPAISVCRVVPLGESTSWNGLNISESFHLPPLDDENMRKAIFGGKLSEAKTPGDPQAKIMIPRLCGTDYKFGFQYDGLECLRQEEDRRTMEALYAFPTLLPCFHENTPLSEILPFQKDSTLASKSLEFIRSMKLKDAVQPVVVVQECLSACIKRQVDHVGKHILFKLMGDWRLMDELFVLRAVYLLGSGDLLQQFLIIIFDRLDKGDSCDDDFELNTILQESIRNSADKMLLTAPDSLVASITKHDLSNDEESVSTSRKVRTEGFGIDALDMLNFAYKVSWPLDLIVNVEALKKYNLVMGFLLKVKRAKFVLDKTRKWMWKGRGCTSRNLKRHLLVEQKLLHFVDAFHQYVMDQVYHSAWTELCTGMASAGSLDEVMEVHEAYLSSIQRQCFVAPDKLWALIASRVKTILGLALDFHNVQQTLGTGGTAPAIKARCEMDVDRIEKQFDECVAFLLRILSFKLNVGHFPHLADLVARINYNYYYMSDTGSLLTVPGSRPR